MPNHSTIETAVLAGIALLFCAAILAISLSGPDTRSERHGGAPAADGSVSDRGLDR